MSLCELVGDLKEEYFSDLKPDEIPNSEISDVSESELDGQTQIETIETAATDAAKMALVKTQTEDAIEKNHNFMRDFVHTYKTDPSGAKR